MILYTKSNFKKGGSSRNDISHLRIISDFAHFFLFMF